MSELKIDLTKKKNVLEWYRKLDFSEIRKKYTDPGTRYAFDVLDGKIISGYIIQLACFRHLRDLQRQGRDEFPCYYSLPHFKNFLKFASLVPNIDDLSQPLELMDWQKFIFSQIEGWRSLDDLPRFKNIVLSIARAQGKTMLAGILKCHAFLIEALGLSNQDFLISSINFDQTMKLFGYVKSMMAKII